MKTGKHRLALLIICTALSMSSCGYHFSGEGEGPKPGLKYIAVPVFENKTSEPDLGAIVAGALRREFLQKGSLKVVPVEEAEAVFKGTVLSIFITPVAHHPNLSIAQTRVALENRIYVNVDVRCEEKSTGRVIWRGPLQYYKVYLADPLSSDSMSGFESRSAVLRVLAADMAVRIHDRFLSNF